MLAAGERIKQILYSEIENIGKEKIQAKINSSIESSQKYIDKIMSKCITKLTYESNDDDDDDFNKAIVTLCEVLLHFMLTICTLPSERKIRVKNDLILDVIVPNLQSLKTKPDKSIIIQVIKDKMMDLNKTSQLEFLQPNHENIWLISAKPLSATKYTTYTVFPNSGLHNYSNIIIDIDNFLKETGDKSFRFIH
ncbi:MAG TPA: hypothetical protein VKA91_11345 [Nitrososphaeraceae archaeon]|nr:hypothetical protein [Nitrososphaeraceae archaeon]